MRCVCVVCTYHIVFYFHRYTYIYDKRGVEVHCLRDHLEPNVLQFLPHHFLLASVGKSGAIGVRCILNIEHYLYGRGLQSVQNQAHNRELLFCQRW